MGLCLRDSVYCNGTVECPDASDEPPNCHSKLCLDFDVSLSFFFIHISCYALEEQLWSR